MFMCLISGAILKGLVQPQKSLLVNIVIDKLVDFFPKLAWANASYMHFFTDKEQEEKTLQSIAAARKKVKAEIQELSDKLKQSKETKQKLRDELAKLEDKY